MNYFVINLDRSPERWKQTAEQLNLLGISAKRISGVDGKTVPIENWTPLFDQAKFRFCHGVDALPGEYGCYASHLAALKALLESGDESCVIFEDDVQPLKDMVQVVEYLDRTHVKSPKLVRLVTHRIEFFEAMENLQNGLTLGQCWFGPSGSAAAYWVNREAAKILVAKLQPGYLPFDIAIERAWETGVANYVIRPNVCSIRNTSYSTITTTAPVNHRKPVWYKRLGAAQFRTRALFARIFWCAVHRKIV